MTEILKLKNVSKKYKDFLLDSVDLSVPYGCIMGFIGENGAGKSTTLKGLLKLLKFDSGEVYLFGKQYEEDDIKLKEHIGVVFDTPNFSEELTLKEVNQIMKRFYKTWDEHLFFTYVHKFKLKEKMKIKAFSRGMKMKVSLAVALSHDTQLLILDEATSGLDPIVRDEILDIFLEFIQDEKKSILMSSHILSDLEKVCDYLTFIHEGRIVFSESKDELIESYGILRDSIANIELLPAKAIVGSRKHTYGAEALVNKKQIASHISLERASIEEIMLYHIKEA